MRLALLAPVICFTASVLLADTLTLRNGQIVTGTYLGGGAREIRLDMGDHVQTYSIDQVSALQFDSGGASGAANPPAPGQAQVAPPAYPDAASQQTPSQGDPAYSNSAPPPPPPQATYGRNVPPPPSANAPVANAGNPSGVSVPAGTLMTVRMVDAVDSDSSRLGRTYRGSVDEPVIVNGQTLIPRGTDVLTKIVEDTQSGKITGQTAVSLALVTVTINGTSMPVTSQDVREASSSRTTRSAGVIGGTAALGAIIGAVAGGGKGAAIGAASGAAVGTGAQIATHGQRVRIPSETRLTFTLTNPINL